MSEYELQKEYCVKIKLIALEWQWVTLISWCQMNHLGHSSRVMHKLEGKTHNIFEKLKITSQKSTLFGHFVVKYFQITCVDIWFFLNKIVIPYTSHMSDFLLILPLLYYWPFGGSAFVLGCASEKAKNYSVKLLSSKLFFFNLIFGHFYESHGYI